MRNLSTREVAALLGIPPGRLTRAVWDGRIDPPDKGPGGAFCWSEFNIHQASWRLRHRNADDVVTALKRKGAADAK